MSITNRVCPWWVIWIFDNPFRKIIHDPAEILAGLVEAGQTAVDIGCGMGYFTIELARKVGPKGCVIAVDLQEKMLEGVRERANLAGLQDRIRFQLCQSEKIGLNEQVDFVLAFWMVHEVPNQELFLKEIYDHLIPNGKLFVVEPIIHVSRTAFQRTTEIAKSVRFTITETKKVKISRAIVLSKRH